MFECCNIMETAEELNQACYVTERDFFKMEGVGNGSKGGFKFIPVGAFAKSVGTSEPALRFLIALLIGNCFTSSFIHIIAYSKHLLQTPFFFFFLIGPSIVYCLSNTVIMWPEDPLRYFFNYSNRFVFCLLRL